MFTDTQIGRANPLLEFRHLNALGVVLLEIGLWEPAMKLEKNMFAHATDSYAVKAQLIKHAQKRLEPQVGRKYKEIVIKCLTGDFGVENNTEDLKLQRACQGRYTQCREHFESNAVLIDSVIWGFYLESMNLA